MIEQNEGFLNVQKPSGMFFLLSFATDEEHSRHRKQLQQPCSSR